VFILQPDTTILSRAIAQREQWMMNQAKFGDIDVHFIFVPRRTIECDEMLKASRLLIAEKVHHLQLDLLPLEDDLLSLELPDNFARNLLQDDGAYKIYVQNSIARLEQIYGTIRCKVGKGDHSSMILARLKEQAKSKSQDELLSQPSEIDGLFLIDRQVDLVSPFCFNQTYEGLIDEVFGIEAASVRVSQRIVQPDAETEEEKKGETTLVLSNVDYVFKDVRDKHFGVLDQNFSKKLQQIKQIVSEKDKQQTIDQIEDFIARIKDMNPAKLKQLVATHINLASHIKTQISDLDRQQVASLEQNVIMGEDINQTLSVLEAKILKGYDRDAVLRLLCLLSVTQNGIKKPELDAIRKFYLTCYGFEEVVTLMNLHDAGLLKLKDRGFEWAAVKKAYNLLDLECNPLMPVDFSYVHNGYAPLSVRLIQSWIRNKGMKNMQDKLRLLQGQPYSSTKAERELFESDSATKKRILIYFVGGVTYAEIAAVRFLNGLHPDYKFMVATTCVLNGNKAIQSMRVNLENLLNSDDAMRNAKK